MPRWCGASDGIRALASDPSRADQVTRLLADALADLNRAASMGTVAEAGGEPDLGRSAETLARSIRDWQTGQR